MRGQHFTPLHRFISPNVEDISSFFEEFLCQIKLFLETGNQLNFVLSLVVIIIIIGRQLNALRYDLPVDRNGTPLCYSLCHNVTLRIFLEIYLYYKCSLG